MEKLIQARQAVAALEDILEEPFSVIVRDATIQRVEFSSEAVWKAAREWLYTQESIEANHPRGSFRELFRIGQMDEALSMKLLDWIDDRNRTSHAYVEALAQAVFEKIPQHLQTLKSVLRVIQQSDSIK
ncbi:nucleotidyltransferase [Coraliomargarita sinensis]|uniref:Nucleotidyltransferase n=1 Tax=Coraliomargarita sinensis TaxID=2174842 RepID=A0A317ZER8_9BACT|nr:HI0074 family nucleotidyltransferase substrate-binding subunit [Coraliomargarita sinensis]PXA03292.1 nucleotidyltransferase [Coraliomargarita sinensis]